MSGMYTLSLYNLFDQGDVVVNFDDIDNVENRPENGEMKSRLDCGNMSFTFSHARDASGGKVSEH